MRLSSLIVLLTIAGSATSHAQPATLPSDAVRVRLFEREAPRCVTVSASDAVAFHTRVGRPATLTARSATVCSDARGVRLTSGDRTIRARTVEAVAPLLTLAPGERLAAESARTYPGSVRFEPEGESLLLVNTAPLDAYVASVVTHEYGLDDDAGTAAQAIVARTYALRMQQQRRDDAYDVADHTGDQVYRGMADVTERALAAARSTRGLVVTYDGALAQTVYSASNGGHGADNEDVWSGSPVAYLRGRPDPYDRVSPVHTWRSSLDRSRVLRALSSAAGRSVTGWTIGERTPDGRVATVNLLHGGGRSQIAGTRFRSILSASLGVHALRSTLFDATREGDRYVFEGRGYGHGVGMSQWGAHGMAQQGKSARDILAFYYPGTQVARREEPERYAAAPEPPRPATPSAERTREAAPASAQPQKAQTRSVQTRRIGW